MSKGNATELDLLKKIFNNTALPWDAITDLYVSLHTADPGEADSQLTSEANYAGYARVAATRAGGGWTASANPVVNAAEITFPQCTGGASVVTHVGIGTLGAGAGQLLYSGALAAPLSISNLITPRIVAGALSISED